MNTKSRPRGWALKKDVVRIQSFAPPLILDWIDRYCDSRQRARSHLGSQASLFYFFSYSFGESWVSMQELLTSPDYLKGDQYRAKFKVEAYVSKSYLRWLDTMPQEAIKIMDNYDPDYLQELKDRFSNRIYLVRGRSLHLKRMLILYYKACQVFPELIELDLDNIRPQGYTWSRHNFDDLEYLFAYTAKLGELINIDLLKPPALKLTEY